MNLGWLGRMVGKRYIGCSSNGSAGATSGGTGYCMRELSLRCAEPGRVQMNAANRQSADPSDNGQRVSRQERDLLAKCRAQTVQCPSQNECPRQRTRQSFWNPHLTHDEAVGPQAKPPDGPGRPARRLRGPPARRFSPAVARKSTRRHPEMLSAPVHPGVSCVSASSQPSRCLPLVGNRLNIRWLHIWLHVPTPEALSSKGKGL